ncbi:MAG: C25 family cysteine peptidase [Candidatus Cloacimonadales bacterium]|nr:C25 family cysteine peptidase [Candidatus Cloacimonadales bacterium]
MKKILILTLFLSLSMLLFSDIEISRSSDRIHLSYTKNDENETENKISQVLALPSSEVDINVLNCRVEVLNSEGEVVETRSVTGSDFARVTQNFTMRELFAHSIEIDLSKQNADENLRLENLELEISARDIVPEPRSVSRAFLPVYRAMVDNFDESYLRDLPEAHSKMLIIAHNDPNLLNTLNVFTAWKNAKGIATEVVFSEDIGTTNAQIKNYIQTLYNTEEYPPDYVLIIGDVNGTYAVPSFTIHGSEEDDVTDLPYTLLAGDDYFPEMIIGRISIDDWSQFQTVVSKVIHYEQIPYTGSNWFERATLVAGNMSSEPPYPTTPVKVTQWLRDKMDAYGYQNIDEIYYWENHYNGITAQIVNSINSGVGIVTYRGWGDANGWHYPYFHTESLDQLTNGLQLPVMTSFVCNSGDFANSVDPCLGEKWLTLGSATAPQGGVVFLGPSDLHTSTPFNNSIFSGFYGGLLDEGIHTFGAALLRGKWELWNNFPLNRQNTEEAGALVRFYYHVYNILGDPSIEVWTRTPEIFSCTLPGSISIGTNYLDIGLSTDLDGAVVTAIKGSEVFTTEIVENGQATLLFNCETAGDLQIAITKPNFYPLIQNVSVVSQAVDVGFEECTTGGIIIAGETVQLAVSLHNFGTETATSVSADLSSDNGNVTINTTTANYGDIYIGNSVVQNFEILIDPACPDNETIEFELDISTGSTAKFEIIVNSLSLEVMQVVVNNENGYLEPAQTDDISVTIQNNGTFDTANLQLNLTSLTPELTISAGTSGLSGLNIGENGTAVFTVQVADSCVVGKNLQFQLEVTDAAWQITNLYFSLEVGEIDQLAPTGPDGYGYYAYDSDDRFYTECPQYEWIEIDPQEGGNGIVNELGDDRSFTIHISFDFPFYGVISDSMTICTNGWISLVTTWLTDFNNWTIPSVLGPYGTINPFWDDLIGYWIPGTDDDHYPMRICNYYDQTNHRLIVEWNECVNRQDNVSIEKFEVIFFDPANYSTQTGDGMIQINYQSVSNIDFDGNYATVGIENQAQNDGLLYTYVNQYPASATELRNNFSIRFTTNEPQFIAIAIPVAEFSAEVTEGVAPFEVHFQNETEPLYYYNTYEWDFGDGSSVSTELHPIHIYNEFDDFTVTLTATNSLGTDTVVHEDFITVLALDAPTAAFTVDSYGGIVPVTIVFTNNSVPDNSLMGYYWDFGDSTTSTAKDVVHTYNEPGFYDVTFVASNPVGIDSLFFEGMISVFAEGSLVWPGDTNNDGTVDINDIVPIGIYWDKHGTEREDVTFSWNGCLYPQDWDIQLAAFADCNGDGKVNITDVLGICLNWYSTHSATMNLPMPGGNLEPYRENFAQLYAGLDNNGTELELKNHIARLFGWTIVEPEILSRLNQNYPNPFNPTTNISYSISQPGKVRLYIYNIKGQLVKTLVNEYKETGNFSVSWNGRDEADRQVSSGLYFYRLKKDDKTIDTKKMLLLK